MLRPSALGLAVLLSSPALWSAFVSGSMGITTALVRFLIAVPVAALMLSLLRLVTASYERPRPRRDQAELAAAGGAPSDQPAERR